ncbi:hypothetical protein T11_11240 [Trichinella zimbabwensis]|uniref:MULE transposase domain-containing protein n=1 Tax=Trichinella zimbabwensis TaxID=268475 RepID=A0A0V1GX44_9BILA|nr:hypothetical protein T11_11240 [Trichinella zimbabwensis]
MADVPELHLVPNRSGSMSLVFEGRAYKLRYTGKQKKHWVCSKDKKSCGGAIWTNLDVTSVIKQNDHIENCRVDEHLAYKMEKKAILKKRSAEETKPIPTIYDEEASAASAVPSTSGHFPLFKRVKFTMTTNAGDKFLLWQSASRHILVFAMGSKIRLLAARRTWGMDGTFKGAPQWYQQLFTIHAFVAGKLVPAVYCLCTGKDIGTYGFIFQALINKAAVLGVNLNPQTIICDFETALIPAIQGYFPNTRVQGCYFHFCQAVHRKVGELGLKTRYRHDEETRRKIKMLLATAFLPVPQVNTGVSLLETGTTDNLLALFQYFRQEWMTHERLPLWNVHNVNIRTNNHLEGWHNRLNRKAGKTHNGLYELLQILIAEQGVMDTLIRQVLSGNATVGDLRRVNRVYVEKQQRVEQYTGNATVGDLRRVNRVYAEKQQRVEQYTGEYTNGSRTLEQFLEALMYITPEPI